MTLRRNVTGKRSKNKNTFFNVEKSLTSIKQAPNKPIMKYISRPLYVGLNDIKVLIFNSSSIIFHLSPPQ